MDPAQILAFRLAHSGLAGEGPRSLSEAARCPAADFSRDAALLALAARRQDLTRVAYDEAVDGGELTLAHSLRGAIHALAPGDASLHGRALISTDDNELAGQLGNQVKRLSADHGFAPTDALAEVAQAIGAALDGGRALDKNELHAELRERVAGQLMPWCRGCGSHHVAPMLWRYGTVAAGARLDSERRFVDGPLALDADPREAVRRFLHFYGPGVAGEFAEWAGVARPHAARLWKGIEDELTEVRHGRRTSWVLAEDAGELDSPAGASGVRLIPPGDPYLQKPNRPLLAPGAELRKRMFRPVASPGAVISDGGLAGLWRVKAEGRKARITVERLGRLARRDVLAEAGRIARLRGAAEAELVLE